MNWLPNQSEQCCRVIMPQGCHFDQRWQQSFAVQNNRRMWPLVFVIWALFPPKIWILVQQTFTDTRSKILKTTSKWWYLAPSPNLVKFRWHLYLNHYATFALMMMPTATDAVLSSRVERLISPTVIWTGKLPPLSSLFIFTKDCWCRSWVNLPHHSRKGVFIN